MKRIQIVLVCAMAVTGFSGYAAGETLAQTHAAQMRTMSANQVFSDPKAIELAQAVAKGDVQKIQALASPQTLNAKGRDDVTLLEWAVLNQKTASLNALLGQGANPALQGMDGQTVLHLAAQVKDAAYLKLLLAHKVNPNLAAKDGASALINALLVEQRDNLKVLLNAGANPNQKDIAGSTPLHVAARIKDYDSIMILLENGANPKAVNRSGATFQTYLVPDPYVLLNANGKRKLARIHDWLKAHGIAIEGAK